MRIIKTTVNISIILLISTIFYYFYYSFISNDGTESMCKNIICIPILSFPEFLTIITGVIGIVLVIESLRSWKDQDAYNNSMDINLKLSEYIHDIDISIIIKIMNLDKNLSLNEKKNEIKNIIPVSGIGSPISNLCCKIGYENIYYRDDFNELSKIIEKMISSIWDIVDKENNDFQNIDFLIQRATRDNLKEAVKLNEKLRSKLHDLIK